MLSVIHADPTVGVDHNARVPYGDRQRALRRWRPCLASPCRTNGTRPIACVFATEPRPHKRVRASRRPSPVAGEISLGRTVGGTMREAAFWRQLRDDFKGLVDHQGFRYHSTGDWLDPGAFAGPGECGSLRTRFRACAIRGGQGLGASPEEAVAAWLEIVGADCRAPSGQSIGSEGSPGPIRSRRIHRVSKGPEEQTDHGSRRADGRRRGGSRCHLPPLHTS